MKKSGSKSRRAKDPVWLTLRLGYHRYPYDGYVASSEDPRENEWRDVVEVSDFHSLIGFCLRCQSSDDRIFFVSREDKEAAGMILIAWA